MSCYVLVTLLKALDSTAIKMWSFENLCEASLLYGTKDKLIYLNTTVDKYRHLSRQSYKWKGFPKVTSRYLENTEVVSCIFRAYAQMLCDMIHISRPW